MESAHHHRNAAGTAVVGDLVGPARGERLDGQRDRVGVQAGERPGHFVVEGDLDPSRGQRLDQ